MRFARACRVLWLVTLAGCQLAPPAPLAAGRDVRLDIPFFPQERYQCGPAALASVLQAAGHPVSADALVDEVWLPRRKGSLPMELAAAARSRGLLVYPVETPRALFLELDAGRPVLVMQNLLFRRRPEWHFAVVTGYRDGGRTVLLHSGLHRHMEGDWSWFWRTWEKAVHTGFVVTGDVLPVESGPLVLAGALDALTQASGRQPVELWQQAARRHPDSALIHFGLGNALYVDGSAAAAIGAYREAVSLRPGLASAWNNLADALGTAGCPASARAAAARALELEPDSDLFAATAAAVAAGQDSGDCPGPASLAGGTAPSAR